MSRSRDRVDAWIRVGENAAGDAVQSPLGYWTEPTAVPIDVTVTVSYGQTDDPGPRYTGGWSDLDRSILESLDRLIGFFGPVSERADDGEAVPRFVADIDGDCYETPAPGYLERAILPLSTPCC